MEKSEVRKMEKETITAAKRPCLWVDRWGEENQLMAYIYKSDNMDPYIRVDTPLLIDTQIKKFEGDGVYAFRVEGGTIVIKRLSLHLDGKVKISDDNSSYSAMDEERRMDYCNEYSCYLEHFRGLYESKMLGRVVFKLDRV